MDKKEFNKKLGRNIRNQRELKLLMQEDLANKLNVSAACISSWENGRTAPKYDMLQKIADILSCEPNDLLPIKPANQNHIVIRNPHIENIHVVGIDLGEIQADEAEFIMAYRKSNGAAKLKAYAELIKGSL